MKTATATIPGYEICNVNDFFAEGMAAYVRDAASPYGAAPPEEVYSLLYAHYEWNLKSVARIESALALLVEGYEEARKEAAEAAV